MLCSFQGTFAAISPVLGVKVRVKQLGWWNKPMKDGNQGMSQENRAKKVAEDLVPCFRCSLFAHFSVDLFVDLNII